MAKIDQIDRPTDTLFILFHFAEEIRGITKIQKLLFLIEEETAYGEKYRQKITLDFEGYKMGPFSPNVYDEVEFLLNLGAIEKESIKFSSNDRFEIKNFDIEEGSEGLSGKLFRITPKGEKIADDLINTLESSEKEELKNVIVNYNDMTLMELLEYVYKNYPAMTTESEIKEEVLQ